MLKCIRYETWTLCLQHQFQKRTHIPGQLSLTDVAVQVLPVVNTTAMNSCLTVANSERPGQVRS